MTELAMRYARNSAGHEIRLDVPRGAATRVHLPDHDAKAHLVTAVLKARGEADEELELFGEPTSALRARKREQLRARVGALSPVVGLIGNLNAWENISLPAAYHGSPPLPEVARLAHEVLEGFGLAPRAFFAKLPDQLGPLERKVTALARLLVAPPELAVMDALEEGLTHAECACVGRFEAEYRARRPDGTLLYVDTLEDA